MGRQLDSAEGFMGVGSGAQGPQAPTIHTYDPGLQALNDYNANNPNAAYINPATASQSATSQVQNNPLEMQGLNNMQSQFSSGQGLENSQTDQLNQLQNQGFQLQPQDMTQYGQTSGNIARMFGTQGNQASTDLANRGLASAPSGAAGAMFSGINGNQNEMLAQAQQQIMQQRFQNTQSQIAQQQNFIGSLHGQNNSLANQQAGQGQSAVNSQYNNNLSGADQQLKGYEAGAGLQGSANQNQNAAEMGAANFNQENKPENFMDQSIQNSNTASSSFSKGLGSAGSGAM